MVGLDDSISTILRKVEERGDQLAFGRTPRHTAFDRMMIMRCVAWEEV